MLFFERTPFQAHAFFSALNFFCLSLYTHFKHKWWRCYSKFLFITHTLGSEDFCAGVLGGCGGPPMPPAAAGQPQNGIQPPMLPSCLSDPYSPLHVGQGCVSGIGSAVLPGNAPKTKKIMYDLLDNEEFDREEIPTYEDVARLFPRPGVFRPIVMIGPPGVGRNELKRRLMAMEPERCKATIPRKFLKSIYRKFTYQCNVW